MLASFFRNALLLVVLNLLVKGVYLFGIERVVQNRLPEGEYGLYFSLLGVAMLFQVVADFGLQLYNSRTISGHRQLLEKYFPYFMGLKLLLGGVFLVAVLLAGWVLGYSGETGGLLLLAAGVQFGNSLVLYLRSNLSGLCFFRLDGFVSVADKTIVSLVVGTVLLWFPERLNIFFFARTQALAWLTVAVVLGWLLHARLPRRIVRFDRAKMLMLLRGGAPFALAIFLQTAYTRTDAVMIERLLPDGAAAAGHYAAGYRLLDALNMIGWLVAGLLLPMYARLLARREELRPLFRFSVHLLLAGGGTVAVILLFFASPLVYFLYDFAEPRTAHVLAFLGLSFLAQCGNYAYGSLLSAAGLIGRMNRWFALAIVLNVAGNWWAIGHYGAAGAAAVTLVTQGGIAVLQAGLVHRWLPLAGHSIAWARLVLQLAGVAGLAFAAGYLPFPWPVKIALTALGGGALAVGMRLLSVREILSFLRER